MSNGNNIVQKNNPKADKVVLTLIVFPILFGIIGGIFWAIASYISFGLSFCLFLGGGIGFIVTCIVSDPSNGK